MSQKRFFQVAVLIPALLLSGCSDIVQNQIDNFSGFIENKINDIIDKITDKLENTIDDILDDIKKRLSDAAKAKIDEWLDQNLPDEAGANLSDDDYARLIQEHPELEAFLENNTDTGTGSTN